MARTLGRTQAATEGPSDGSELHLLSTLFLVAVGCAILGNAFGIMAWRKRRPDLPSRSWLSDPMYLLRNQNFLDPRAPARILALGLLGVGVVSLSVLAFTLMSLQRAGVQTICGFNF